MQSIIEASSLSKTYMLGQVGAATLRDDLQRLWFWLKRKERVTAVEANLLNETAQSNWIKALDDVSFSIMPGERVGIIGRNGAGKSTLLKILSRITAPSSGEAIIRGRMASLLEVGTGFHPEFTGRENVYLNGTLLGMTKEEVAAKFEEIIEFAGIGRYIDTPVKRYSSGMRVRLGFAVAAHLDPDVLIVDEVLAVGDVEFQNKAIGKMRDSSKGKQRTVLFVSHNMDAISSLCERVIVMQHGKLVFDGPVRDGISAYLQDVARNPGEEEFVRTDGGVSARIEKMALLDSSLKETRFMNIGERYIFRVCARALSQEVRGIVVEIAIYSHDGKLMAVMRDDGAAFSNITSDFVSVDFTWDNIFSPGRYEIVGKLVSQEEKLDRVASFFVEVPNFVIAKDHKARPGIVQILPQINYQ
jgi:lipopolysaccharide transport system ATP-binding protein